MTRTPIATMISKLLRRNEKLSEKEVQRCMPMVVTRIVGFVHNGVQVCATQLLWQTLLRGHAQYLLSHRWNAWAHEHKAALFHADVADHTITTCTPLAMLWTLAWTFAGRVCIKSPALLHRGVCCTALMCLARLSPCLHLFLAALALMCTV